MWSYMLYIKGEEYLKRLVAQKLFITRDLRLLAENLARGKIAVTSGIGYSEFQPFIKANLPVVPLPVPKEGLYASGGYGHLVILKNQPHPNATRVFVNWLLGRDGQEIFARGMGVGTRRLDIGTQWLRKYGVIAAKDGLTIEQFYKMENQSEEKVYKIREPGAAVARKLLGSWRAGAMNWRFGVMECRTMGFRTWRSDTPSLRVAPQRNGRREAVPGALLCPWRI